MAYPSPPKTWAAAEKDTAILRNAQLRDALLALQDGAWGADRPYVRKPSGENVVNSATVQNDDHLLFTGTANATYQVEVGLLVQVGGSSSTSDFKLGWSLPASALFAGGGNAPEVAMAAASSVGQGEWSGVVGASAATLSYGLFSTGVTLIMFHGNIVLAGTAGTCNLQWAQNTATAVTTTVLAGSWLSARRTA